MILIISDYYDQSVNDIGVLISDQNISIEIVDTVTFLSVIEVEYSFTTNQLRLVYKKNELTAVWFKRVKTWHNSHLDSNDAIDAYLDLEMNSITDFLFSSEIYTKTRILSSFKNSNLNKLFVLKKAIECGLIIPQSYIVTKLLNKDPKQFISKAAFENLRYNDNGNIYMQYVDLISNIIPNNKKEFLPSFIQQKISRKIEIRTCYFFGKLFSMGVQSERHIDIRKYDKNKNRFPVILPKEYEVKLIKLMNLLNIDLACIDTILEPNGQYYFLEVNPNGNFTVLSETCGYNIENKVAKYLISGVS